MFSAFAEFERNRIRERTQEGLNRAKAEGKKLGRPAAKDTTRNVQRCKAEGLSQSATAKELGSGISQLSVIGISSRKLGSPSFFPFHTLQSFLQKLLGRSLP